ncbi:hypothetical protein KBB49_02890 [Candidatus Saccharibacteria bacterium]|nr:hypothetical protein [Candidatus Saccharibacteria bacterium]
MNPENQNIPNEPLKENPQSGNGGLQQANPAPGVVGNNPNFIGGNTVVENNFNQTSFANPSVVSLPPKNKANRTKIVLIVAFIAAILIIGLLAIIGSRDSKKTDTSNTSNNSSTSNDAVIEKADKFIEVIKKQGLITKEYLALGKEMDTYAKYIDKPNLTSQERRKESLQIGVKIGLYSSVIEEGTIKRTGSENIDSNKDYVVVKYAAENPNSKAFSGPYEFLIFYAYIDGDWRLVDFQVKDV